MKKLLSFWMALLLLLTSCPVGMLVSTQAAEEEPIVKVSGEMLVNSAMKYLGYGYRLGGSGADGTIDCTGLVEMALRDLGVTNVPTNTSTWISRITSKNIGLVYEDGTTADTIYTSSLAEYNAAAANKSNANKFIVLTTTVDSDTVKTLDLAKGTILVSRRTGESAAHASIVIGTVEQPVIKNFDKLWQYDYEYYDKVIEECKDYENFSCAKARPVGHLSNFKKGDSFYDPKLYTQIRDSDTYVFGAEHYASRNPDEFLVWNAGAYQDVASHTASLGNSLWVIEASNPNIGVAITNHIGGKGSGNVPMYAIRLPEESYEATIGVKKINSRTNAGLSGAEISLYEDPSCTIPVIENEEAIVLKSALGGLSDKTLTWDGAATKTIYAKETKAPNACVLKDTIYRIELDADSHTGTWYDNATNKKLESQTQDGIIYYIIENEEATVGLSIYVRKDETEVPVPVEGAEFGMYATLNDAKSLTNAITSGLTDANGYCLLNIENTTSNSYYIRESRAPQGFVIDPTIHLIECFKITDATGTTKLLINSSGYYSYNAGTWSYKNDTYGQWGDSAFDQTSATYSLINDAYKISVEITKENATTHTRLPGAEFGLYEWDKYKQIYIAIGTVKDTNNDGVYDVVDAKQAGVAVTQLHYTSINEGKFQIRETKAPAGYIINQNKFNFVIATSEATSSTVISNSGTYRVTVSEEVLAAEGDFTVKAYKELKDKDLVGGEFNFLLHDIDGKFADQIKTNAADGSVTFDTFIFDENDIGMTYTLELSEVQGATSWIEYDSSVYTININVVDSGKRKADGTRILSVTATDEANVAYTPVQFTNTYHAEGSFTIEAKKQYENHNLTGGEFTFVLTDVTEGTKHLFTDPITATNDAQGNVVFKTVDVTKAQEGTYKLTLKEVTGNKAYIDYDKHEVTITVKVDDNQTGTMVCTLLNAAGHTYNPITDGLFENTYHAKGEFKVEAYKEFKNQELQGGEFAFVLTDVTEGTKHLFTDTLTATNDKNGNVVFAAVNVTEADLGTYTLKLREVEGGKAYIDYDNHEVEITVEVKDNGTGTMVCTLLNAAGITYKPKEDGIFTNTYNAEGSFVVKAYKEFKNQELVGGEFEFVLTDETGTLFSTLTAVNDKNGNVVFKTVNVTEAQLGTHKLILKEKAGTKAYIDYDNHEVEITVTISDNKDGTLSCTLTNAAGITYKPKEDGKFINTYNAEGSFTVKAYKEFKKGTLQGGEFEFVLTDETGTLFSTLTAVNDKNGNVVFKTVDVTEAQLGTYTLKLKEKAGTKAYIDYDNHEVAITVTISDNGDGTLTCILTNAAGITYEPEKDGKFTNTYHAKGSFVIKAYKEFKNQTLQGGEFEFVLTDETGTLFTELTATNDKDGNVVFKTVDVTEANIGTYTLTLKEKEGTKAYIDYDNHEVSMTVTITDNQDGTLSCILTNADGITYEPEKDGKFTNTYHATGDFTVKAYKEFNEDLEGGEFEFVLTNEQGTLLTNTLTATNDAAGNVTFIKVNVTEAQAGTYTLKLKEKEGTKAYIDYDNHEVLITVSITDNGDGTMNCTLTNAEGITYQPTKDGKFINYSNRAPQLPMTGGYLLWVYILAAALVIIAGGLLILAKKETKK